MPKNVKAKKNTKSSGAKAEKRKLIEADPNGQVYGIVEKVLGNRFFTVNCLDNVSRRCKVRQKRMKIVVGNYIIVSLRDFEDSIADIIYCYNFEEVRQLQKMGILPMSDVSDVYNVNGNDEEFVFEDI